MAISIADNFSYQGGKPLDARVKFSTVNEMVAVPAANLYDGCFAYVAGTKKYYSYDSSNETDPTLGKWKEYSSGGTSDYDELTDKPQINSVTLSGNKSLSDLGIAAAADIPSVATTSAPGIVQPDGTTVTINDGVISAVGGGGTSDYTDLTNKPQINGNTLSGNKTSSQLGIQEIQKSTMPTAAAGNVGQIVQYIGASDANYTNGYFYQCVENSGVYSWANIAVTPIPNFDYSNEFGAENIYSTTEKMIGQWTDGKPLYQKTINFGALPNATSKNVAHGIANVDKIWVHEGFVDTGSLFTTCVYANTSSAQNNWNIYADSTNICITTGINRSDRSAIVTVRYTKTTDSATSIGTGNEYSTTEKIVGTWTDGRYIWQRTWTSLDVSVSQSTWAEVATLSGVDIMIGSGEATVVYTQDPAPAGTSADLLCVRGSIFVKVPSAFNGYKLRALTVRYIKTSS